MNPRFTLPYEEYRVAEKLTKYLDGVSTFIPMSRQEKGIDLILYRPGEKQGANKVITVQVKSSKVYYEKGSKLSNRLWFNRFKPSINSDLFILYGTYPRFPDKGKIKIMWEEVMLVFKYNEMVDFLKKVTLVKDHTKEDRMFGFGFDDSNRIIVTRGALAKGEDYSNYLIQHQIDNISKMFYK